MDNLVRNFNYEEKPKVFEYYPQYYHKIDKVQLVAFKRPLQYTTDLMTRMDALFTSNNLVRLT